LKQIDEKYEEHHVNKDETVTSSKFILNHRDKHNIVDFLSANNSDGLMSGTMDTNMNINNLEASQQAMLI